MTYIRTFYAVMHHKYRVLLGEEFKISLMPKNIFFKKNSIFAV